MFGTEDYGPDAECPEASDDQFSPPSFPSRSDGGGVGGQIDYGSGEDDDFYDEEVEEEEELDIEAVLAEIDDMDLTEDQ
eukprot:8277771-Pyramimonas_sp.AAC.1